MRRLKFRETQRTNENELFKSDILDCREHVLGRSRLTKHEREA